MFSLVLRFFAFAFIAVLLSYIFAVLYYFIKVRDKT